MTGKIFLSYRREDTAGFAQALFGRLEQSFPAESLFMDVAGGIGAGQDFVRVLEEQVSACDAMLVLIGPNWLTVRDGIIRRRLDNPRDFVRIEVEAALRLGKRVIPVLVQSAEMPRADALPEPLKALARRNAVGLTQERFKADAQGLIKALEDALREVEEARRAISEAAAAAEERAAKAEEAARAEKERARLDAIVGLSPEQIAKAEELANWDFIKASESIEDFRDHLARFPRGVSERWARARFEALVWARLPKPIDMAALKGFLAEFPKGAHASEVNTKLAELEAQASTARETAERTKKLRLDAWAPARAGGTEATLEAFRTDWPNGNYPDAARARGNKTKAVPSRSRLLLRSFSGHTDWVNSVAFSPDGRSALSGSKDETLKLWDVATGAEIRVFVGHGSSVDSVAFSPDGRTALSGGSDDEIKVWDVATGKELRAFSDRHSNKYVLSYAFSPDRRSVLSGNHDGTLKLSDVATGKEIRFFVGHGHSVDSVAFSPDGRKALSGGRHKVQLWDVATGEEVGSFAGYATSVAFSPDGRSALFAGGDCCKLWNLATGKEICTFKGVSREVTSVVFSPDGRRALSGSQRHTLRLWDVAAGKEIRIFSGHTDWVTSVAISPDGRTALSGSWDKTLKLWDLTDRR
jgi:hypothetical protein